QAKLGSVKYLLASLIKAGKVHGHAIPNNYLIQQNIIKTILCLLSLAERANDIMPYICAQLVVLISVQFTFQIHLHFISNNLYSPLRVDGVPLRVVDLLIL
ncbi:hypothetical protein ACJX0J_034547, partial [Zea mays]